MAFFISSDILNLAIVSSHIKRFQDEKSKSEGVNVLFCLFALFPSQASALSDTTLYMMSATGEVWG